MPDLVSKKDLRVAVMELTRKSRRSQLCDQVQGSTTQLPLWAFVFWSVWKDLRTLESGVREIQIRVGDPTAWSLRTFHRVPSHTELGK